MIQMWLVAVIWCHFEAQNFVRDDRNSEKPMRIPVSNDVGPFLLGHCRLSLSRRKTAHELSNRRSPLSKPLPPDLRSWLFLQQSYQQGCDEARFHPPRV